MNQYPSHSNIPAFAKNESNTKPVLYQHPKPSEMGKKPFAQFLADLRDFMIFIIFSGISWLVITVIVSWIWEI